MTESWNRRAPRSGSTASGIARLVSLMVAALLIIAGGPPPVRADGPTSGDSRLLAPIADVLSASSWLWATGQDPRSSPAMAGSALWHEASGSTATPLASPGDAIVSSVVGQFPVSSEPSLAVDPRDSNHLVLAVSALDLPSVATYVSEDGGQTWDGPHQAPYFAGDDASLGAPFVAFDRQGVVYLAARSVAVEPVPVGLQLLPVERVRITLSRSDDGGRQWGSAVSAVTTETITSLVPDASGLMSGSVTTAFLDSPSLAIGSDPGRPDREIITIAYAELRTSFVLLEAPERVRLSGPATESSIQVIRSDDGGQSWSQPVTVSPVVARGIERPPVADAAPDDAPTGEAAPVAPTASSSVVADGDQIVQGPHVVALDDGAIAVAYLDTTRDGPRRGLARVMVVLTDDGGRTYSEPRQAGVFREISDRPATAFFRWWDGAFPHLTSGPDGALFVAVAARLDGQGTATAGMQLFRSLDRGEQWESLPVEASEPDGARFFPAIAASDSELFAIWGELGAEPAGAGYVIRAATSDDRGQTWQLLASQSSATEDGSVSATVSNALLGFPRGLYLGGRLSIAAGNDGFAAAWPDTRLADGASSGQQVAFARIPASQPD